MTKHQKKLHREAMYRSPKFRAAIKAREESRKPARKRDPIKNRAYVKAWRKKNPGKVKAQNQRYHQKHLSERRAAGREYAKEYAMGLRRKGEKRLARFRAEGGGLRWLEIDNHTLQDLGLKHTGTIPCPHAKARRK